MESNIKDRKMVMLSIITELRKLCDNVIVPLSKQ